MFLTRDWAVITDMARVVLSDADTRVDAERIEETPEENEEDEDGDDRVKTETSRARDGTRPACNDQPMKENAVMTPVAKRKPNLHVTPHVKGGNPKRSSEFGISLLLSNVPMSPKIVNGSFAAMFEGDKCRELSEVTRHLSVGGEFLRLSPRRRGRLGEQDKQMSLDYSVLDRHRGAGSRTMVAMGSLDSKIDEILELGSAAAHRENNTEKVTKGETNPASTAAGTATKVAATTTNGSGKAGDFGHTNPNGHVKNGTVRDGDQEGGRILEQERWDTGHQISNGGCSSPQPERSQVKPAARVIEISKAVASKVKGVLMTFPSSTPTQPQNGAENQTNGTRYCQHCGHILSATQDGGKFSVAAKE